MTLASADSALCGPKSTKRVPASTRIDSPEATGGLEEPVWANAQTRPAAEKSSARRTENESCADRASFGAYLRRFTGVDWRKRGA